MKIKDNNLPDGDYTLIDGAAWFTVGYVSIRIRSTPDGVIIETYAANSEMEEPISCCEASFEEALTIIEGEDDY